MFVIKIIGNAYSGNPKGIDTTIQFYNYNSGNYIGSGGGTHHGFNFGNIKVFNYNNKVCIWFQQAGNYQTYKIFAYSNTTRNYNVVEGITNAAMPTTGVTREVTITPEQSALVTDNVASASKLTTTTAGSATRPVYFANGIPVAGTYTFGNASGNAAINNGTLCSNLNADMLDGYQLTSLFRQKDLTPQSLNADNLNTNYICYNPNSDMSNWSSSYTFTNFPTARPAGGFSLLTIKEGYYQRQIYGAYISNHLYVRSSIYSGGTSRWLDWNKIAFTTDNVASATKLQTARTIWGQNFDGTGNVSGTFTSGIISIGSSNEIWSTGAPLYINHSTRGGQNIHMCTGNGNVGIGTISPAYKLDVSGTGRFSGNVTAPTFIGALSGNAATATSAGSITGFTSGWSNSGEHNANNISSNGMWYYTSNGPTTAQGFSTNDGALYSQAYSTT